MVKPRQEDINIRTSAKSVVLLTTANYPDVMMPSYNKDSLSVVFFFTYLMICLYFLMNLLLAVVYEAFTAEEAKKFKKCTRIALMSSPHFQVRSSDLERNHQCPANSR